MLQFGRSHDAIDLVVYSTVGNRPEPQDLPHSDTTKFCRRYFTFAGDGGWLAAQLNSSETSAGRCYRAYQLFPS